MYGYKRTVEKQLMLFARQLAQITFLPKKTSSLTLTLQIKKEPESTKDGAMVCRM